MGPFVARVDTPSDHVRNGVELLYDASMLVAEPEFCDFRIAVTCPPWRRLFRPNLHFVFEGASPFKPAPWDHGLVLFEWGLNWAIATTVNHYLVIHSASLERNGKAIILPGPPGSGKSTLCTGLALRGWRLLSDELTLIRLDGAGLAGLARPMSLKNQSIDVIRNFAPDAVMSPRITATQKGTISLVKPAAESVRRVGELARPGWVVVPHLALGGETRLERRPKPENFLELAANALNYGTLGERGFTVLADLIEASECFDLSYGNLDFAVRLLTALADGERVS